MSEKKLRGRMRNNTVGEECKMRFMRTYYGERKYYTYLTNTIVWCLFTMTNHGIAEYITRTSNK